MRFLEGWVSALFWDILCGWGFLLDRKRHMPALHTVYLPSSWGTFVTSIETRVAFSGTLVFSMKLMKSVVSSRYDSCFSATGCSSLSINRDSLSVSPSQPDIIGLPTGAWWNALAKAPQNIFLAPHMGRLTWEIYCCGSNSPPNFMWK